MTVARHGRDRESDGLASLEDGDRPAAARALASGFANAELPISITLCNERVPARRRGPLDSILQGGWPVGVFLAFGVYLLTASHCWRYVLADITVGTGFAQGLSTLILPKLSPGRELEEVVI